MQYSAYLATDFPVRTKMPVPLASLPFDPHKVRPMLKSGDRLR
jgi:hypothetical protein